MSDVIFRTRESAAPEAPSVQPATDDGTRIVNETELPAEKEAENNLEFWEKEHHKKYINECLDTHNLYNDFGFKMQISQIDKYVRNEMEERKYANTRDNYKSILDEIEEEIGSSRLGLSERLRKLSGYTKALNKLKESKKKVGEYKYVRPDR